MRLENLVQHIEEAAEQAQIRIIEEKKFEAQPAKMAAIPAELHSKIYEYLNKTYPTGLYQHQADAIRAILDDEDVCLATPTASGKSLIFMTATADMLLSRPKATALALYPAKALIQDQIGKWQAMLTPLGITVGFIDGSVTVDQRYRILQSNQIVLMTPDVVQAWMMANLRRREVAAFMANLNYLILDEAHVYSGVFGSNMAYLLRRMQGVSNLQRIISSTATIGEPREFIEKLSGRKPRLFTEANDGSPTPPKAILLAEPTGDNFKQLVDFVVELSRKNAGTFIAFADSRRMVEMFVAAAKRQQKDQEVSDDFDGLDEKELEELMHAHVLPYRAGYEEEDRKQIQLALGRGELRGVVSTSGLELGIDIGDIKTVVLLGTPPSIQAFRQRFGRMGRKKAGVCVFVDTKGLVNANANGLEGYLNRKAEKGWMYLENRFIQYTNALCAAAEIATASNFQPTPFKTLPHSFLKLVENELNPTENLPQDFFNLKQRAQNGAHFEFPVRSGIEKNFKVRRRQGPNIYALGNLSHSQALREGYPGAVYYYMARPYRVYEFNFRAGEINVRQDAYYTTKPLAQNMVFPKLPHGGLKLWKSAHGFLMEAELQVSERVTGFVETKGGAKTMHIYQPGSEYYEKPLMRMFETTGVCWYFSSPQLITEAVAQQILEAFCLKYGIQSRDIGIGTFHCNNSPLSNGGATNNCKGICIYDATNGSLRLTQQLAENFGEVVESAVDLLKAQEGFDMDLALNLAHLKEGFSEMTPASFEVAQQIPEPPKEEMEWVTVFAVGERVLYKTGNGDLKTLFVNDYRYTPAGLMYVLRNGSVVTTKASEVFALDENTKTAKYNLYTGDIRQN
jgi:DEAD/DEAH box helicase domain-containing protein